MRTEALPPRQVENPCPAMKGEPHRMPETSRGCPTDLSPGPGVASRVPASPCTLGCCPLPAAGLSWQPAGRGWLHQCVTHRR